MKRIGTLVLAAALCAAAFTAGTAYGGSCGRQLVHRAAGQRTVAGRRPRRRRRRRRDAGASAARMSAKWDAEFSVFGSEHERAGNDAALELQGFGLSAESRVLPRRPRESLPQLSASAQVKAIHKPGVDEPTLTRAVRRRPADRPRARARRRQRHAVARRSRRTPRPDDRRPPIENPVDYVAGIGIQYSWGGTPARRVVDTDGDGVNDDLDKCPGTPAGTAVDSSGCPLPQDDDGDGVTNDIDKCPGTPAGAKVDASGCELDSDGDGVGDSRDQCPNTPAGAKVDEQGCELDSDGDGVVDSEDKCPDTPKGDRVDAIGCSFKEEIKLPGVVFETEQGRPAAREPPGARTAPSRRSSVIRRSTIEVAGHTDSRGSDALNLDLSARRAADGAQVPAGRWRHATR